MGDFNINIKFTCFRSDFESLISLLIFCLIESNSLCIWVIGSLALVVALILLPLYLCCFKIYLIRYENCKSCFLFMYLFIFALHLVGKSFSIPLFWVFVYPCMWNTSECNMPLGFGCVFWLGDLVDLNLGLLPFDVNWLFYPFVDVNSSLCWWSLLFDIFLERLILVVSFCV